MQGTTTAVRLKASTIRRLSPGYQEVTLNFSGDPIAIDKFTQIYDALNAVHGSAEMRLLDQCWIVCFILWDDDQTSELWNRILDAILPHLGQTARPRFFRRIA